MIRKGRSTFKPCLETLEDRLCLSPPGSGAISDPALVYRALGGPQNSNSNLYLTTATGSSIQQLTSGFYDYAPFWKPDGSQIAFLRHTSLGVDLDTIHPDGTRLTTLHHHYTGSNADPPPHSESLSWSPDGSYIIYYATFVNPDGSTDNSIWALNVAANTTQALLTNFSKGDNQIRNPFFSPDLDPSTPGYQGVITFGGVDATSQLNGNLNADLYDLNVAIDPVSGAIQVGPLTDLTNSPATQASVDQEYDPAGRPTGPPWHTWTESGPAVRLFQPHSIC